MRRQHLLRTTACITGLSLAAMTFNSIETQASDRLEYKKKVISLAGIMNTYSTDAPITRAEFANMLVNATTYKESISKASNTAVFSDVPYDHTYAGQIKLASEQGWMTGYLGGVFKPDQQITLQEAVRGVLSLLEYTNEDFQGNQAGGRINKYYSLELADGISKEAGEQLTKEDCINLFYNLLRTETKSGNVYATVLGAELTDDGEVNPMELADYTLTGPKVVKRSTDLSDQIPFKLDEATVFLNGDTSTQERVRETITREGYVVVYYNAGSKTLWAYSESGSQTDRAVIQGEVTHIYYQSADVMTPSAVELDDESDQQYQLKSSQIQFDFSIYGNLAIGSEVTLICEVTENADGEFSYTVIDYVEY